MNEPTDIMIDLETMGTDPYSPVVAIGAVRFSAASHAPLEYLRPSDMFYQTISLESCMDTGLKPSASTLKWWLTDPSVTDAARSIFADVRAVPLPNALDAFTDWHQDGPETLWGNSARFDLGLLADCYRSLRKPVPWLHWNEGCYRTLKNLPAVQHIRMHRIGTYHNALDDALSQAKHLCDLVAYLKAYTTSPTTETETI